jgi:hypothetical protein
VGGEWVPPIYGWLSVDNPGGLPYQHPAPTLAPPFEPGDWFWYFDRHGGRHRWERILAPAFQSITGYFTETMEKDKRDAVERAAEAAALERRARGEPDILGYVAERLYIAERLEKERLEKERLEAERTRAEAAPVYGLGRPRGAPIPVIGSPTMRFLGTREIERREKERLKEERRRLDPAAVEREEDQICRNLFEERRKKLGPHHDGSVYAGGWIWLFARLPGEVDEWKPPITGPSLFPWSEEKKIPPKPTKPPPDIPGYYEWNPNYGGYWMGDPIPGRKRYKYWFYQR